MAISVQPVWDRLYTHLSLPVLMKEMRVRMRGLRAPILLGISTALAIIVGLIIIMPGWDTISTNDSRNMVRMGENLFIGITVLEGILCALIAPALTAGAVSIEREQQTLDLLLLTRLSDAQYSLRKIALRPQLHRDDSHLHHAGGGDLLPAGRGGSRAIMLVCRHHLHHRLLLQRHRPVLFHALCENLHRRRHRLLHLPGLAGAVALARVRRTGGC